MRGWSVCWRVSRKLRNACHNLSASYTLTAHAGFVLGERDIPMAWVSRALEHPERTEPDRTDSALIHALGRIPEFGNRILRVIYNDTMVPKRIVTASFERIQWDKI